MADAKLLKDLQIKTNILKRLVKEHSSYIKEAEKEAEKIAKLKEDPATDEYVLKKLVEAQQETKGMVPIVAQKAHAACKELKAFLDANQEYLSDEAAADAKEAISTGNAIPLFY
uniref:Tubulin-specific chaperone A n=1 Tax=Panagrellus redivivus TaxID=6233 RepID=A0A7E4VF59_PANRE